MGLTYQELMAISNCAPSTFMLAFSMLMKVGTHRIKDTKLEEFADSNISKEQLVKVLDLAKKMGDTQPSIIIAVMQRQSGDTLIKGNGDTIPYLTTHNDIEDVCPLCGEAIEYLGNRDTNEDTLEVSWTCTECGASGVAVYNLGFKGHFKVRNKEGTEVKR